MVKSVGYFCKLHMALDSLWWPQGPVKSCSLKKIKTHTELNAEITRDKTFNVPKK